MIMGNFATMSFASPPPIEIVPAAIRCARAQQIDCFVRDRASRREIVPKYFQFVGFRNVAIPKEMDRLFECRIRGELGDRKTGDDELTALAVDHAQFGLCCDNAFQSLVDHDADNLGWVYAYVNIDRSINMKSDDERDVGGPESHRRLHPSVVERPAESARHGRLEL